MQRISLNDILKLIEDSTNQDQSCSSLFPTYLAWSKLHPDFEKELKLIGILSSKNEGTENILIDYESGDYWSADFPIDITIYPYDGCEVYEHLQTACYFLSYTELGGHGAEKRCRLVQRSLISIV